MMHIDQGTVNVRRMVKRGLEESVKVCAKQGVKISVFSPVVEVRVPRGPGAVEGERELLVL